MRTDTEELLLVFGSTARVMAADRLLRTAGLPAGLAPAPPEVPSPCGLCLRLPDAAWPRAERLLAAAGLRPALYERSGEAVRARPTQAS